MRVAVSALVLWAGALLPPTLGAQAIDWDQVGDEAVELLAQYLRINTVNPPGNESAAVEFFAEIFEREGIPYQTAESAPGRGNIWARLEGGAAPALVLLHHMDVVPADERYWTTDPLSGAERDGYLYGRGALDTKGGGILHLATFLALHRAQVRLDRDVIFMATADEEAGGFFGAGWLVEHRPELFENVGFLLNEGGGGSDLGGEVQFGVEVTQKVPLWLRLVAHGEPGHGSSPRPESAVTRLVAALEQLRTHPFPPRIVPAVDAFFKGIAPSSGPEWEVRFRDMRATILDPEAMATLQRDLPALHTLTRNTCSITRLEGSNKINVVPPEARAEIDCRLLPDQDPDAFQDELAALIDDDDIEIERIMGFTPAVSDPNTDLFQAIEETTRAYFPGSTVLPVVQGGFTDSHFFRDLGIVSYGFFPTVTSPDEDGGVHGNDERISVENIRRGSRMMFEIVQRFVARPSS